MSSPKLAGTSSSQFYLGVFLITGATLALQLVQTRILSVISWYHLAFFAISTAMFGLTGGAVWVYLKRDRFSEKTLSFDLAHFASAFAWSSGLSLVTEMTIVPALSPSASSVVAWAEMTVCLSLPFFFSGIVVSIALTRSPFPVGRVYAADLVGAASGCLAVLVLLNLTDAPTAVLWVGVAGAVAAILFNRSRIGREPESKPVSARLLGKRDLVLAVLLVAAIANNGNRFGIKPTVVKGQVEHGDNAPILERWNSFSRIAAFRSRWGEPLLWGPSKNKPVFQVEQRNLNIDGLAASPMYRFSGDRSEVEFLKYDITNLAYFVEGLERAAIIGVGGGRDILSGWLFGVREVSGIEINPIFIDLLTQDSDFALFTRIGKIDGVELIVAEGRSWFAQSNQRYDLIQMSMIDTWAATGAGAFTLSENGLYTVESWKLFVSRLTSQGIFTVSRWHAPTQVNETGRMVSLAVATLMELGVDEPRDHIYLASAGYIATLLLSRSALSSSQLEALDRAAAGYGYEVVIHPQVKPSYPVLDQILASTTRTELQSYTSGLELDLTPPTDDRPFFFNQLPFHKPFVVFQFLRVYGKGVVAGNLVAALSLITILVISAVLVVATIVVPLRPAVRDVGRPLVVAGTAYFFLLGLGFMMAEIGLLQRFSVFLGHPIYSLSVVLFSLIMATGLGSLVSDYLPLDQRGKFAVWSVFLGCYLLILACWLPELLAEYEGARLVVRAGLCVLTIAPAGFLMGFGFPTGMQVASAIDRRPSPWFWGINGAAGVLAAGVSVVLSIALGIRVVMLAAAACYVLLIPAAFCLFRGRKNV